MPYRAFLFPMITKFFIGWSLREEDYPYSFTNLDTVTRVLTKNIENYVCIL